MTDDQITRLERIRQLHQNGALSESEYEAQKKAILSESALPLPASLTPNTPLTEAKKKSNGCVSVIIGLIGAFALIALLNAFFNGNDATPKTRSEIVQSFFSSYDGSHPGLERSIKQSMNDPDSYEHVETRYSDSGSTITVYTKFRGKNAFGGKVINNAQGTIDGKTGELIDWKFVKE